MTCLYCGLPLEEGEETGGWHRRCTRAFFGSDSIPHLEVTNKGLEELAAQTVTTGRTVTGVQRKLSIHLSQEPGYFRLTLVGFPAGYILKPPAPDYPQLPEIEHLTMSIAARIGIGTVPHGLIALADGTRAYITRRVDRRRSMPYGIPMEDLCQLSERLTEDKYRGSYEQVGKVIARYSSRPGIDLSELFLVVLFSFAIGNADMHLKNFSLYRPENSWILAPAYDLLSTCLVIPDDPDEMALALNGRKHKLTREDFVSFGQTIGVHPKAVDRLIDSLISRRTDLSDTIGRSLLERSMATRLHALVDERLERLRP